MPEAEETDRLMQLLADTRTDAFSPGDVERLKAALTILVEREKATLSTKAESQRAEFAARAERDKAQLAARLPGLISAATP